MADRFVNRIKLLPSLLVFAEIAAKGSFTAAGDALGLSKSAVSQQLSRLERELGLQLLVRNTRGVSLTDIGGRLLQRCDLLSDQVELAFIELSNAAEAPSGRFSVTFPHALERTVVNPAIAQLCKEYPGLEPRLIVSDERKDLVRDKIDSDLRRQSAGQQLPRAADRNDEGNILRDPNICPTLRSGGAMRRSTSSSLDRNELAENASLDLS